MQLSIVTYGQIVLQSHQEFRNFIRKQKQNIDLKKVQEKLSFAKKRKEKNLELSRTKIRGKLVLCKSGQVYAYGCDSVFAAHKLVRLTLRDINVALKKEFKLINFKVISIKGQAHLGFSLDLKQMVKNGKIFGSLQSMNILQQKISLISNKNAIFQNGFITIWGINQSQMKQRFRTIKSVLVNFKKEEINI